MRIQEGRRSELFPRHRSLVARRISHEEIPASVWEYLLYRDPIEAGFAGTKLYGEMVRGYFFGLRVALGGGSTSRAVNIVKAYKMEFGYQVWNYPFGQVY